MNRTLVGSILAVVLSSVSYATDQRADIILHNGIIYQLHTPTPNRTLPLDSLFRGDERKPRLWPRPSSGSSTSCHRGYVAIWEIIDDTLFLKGIDAWHIDREEATKTGKSGSADQFFRTSYLSGPKSGNIYKADLRKLFPKRFKKNGVKAEWFSGSLTLTIELYATVMEKHTIRLRLKNGKILANTSPADAVKEKGKPKAKEDDE